MGLSHSPSIVFNGLVLYLDAANPRCYAGSGLTANGLVNSISGTLISGVGFTSLNSGSFVFDGNNDFISIGAFGSFYTQGTISFWINFSDVSVSIRNPFSTNYGTANNVNVLRFETAEVSGSLRCWLGDPSGNVQNLNYSNVSINTWYNVVFSWNQSVTTVSGYLNGNLNASNTSWIRWPSTFANIALGYGYSGRYFSGKISNLQMYSRALTAAEILQNYDATKGRFV
jgi:hypothetical protein